MAGRRRQRAMAVQLAYALDLTGDRFEDARFRFTAHEPERQADWGEFAERLTREMVERRKVIDARVRKALKNWRLERLSTIDRAVLRLAVCEMMVFPEIPLRVTINEFLELAHAFGSDESPAFINGVLDTISKDFPEKDFQAKEEDEEEKEEE